MATAGYVVLVIAIVAAICCAIATVVGFRNKSGGLTGSAKLGAMTLAALYTIALAIILYAFATKDFSLKIVSEHSSLDLPLMYSLSAVYADKAGSMFFWGWLIL